MAVLIGWLTGSAGLGMLAWLVMFRVTGEPVHRLLFDRRLQQIYRTPLRSDPQR